MICNCRGPCALYISPALTNKLIDFFTCLFMSIGLFDAAVICKTVHSFVPQLRETPWELGLSHASNAYILVIT